MKQYTCIWRERGKNQAHSRPALSCPACEPPSAPETLNPGFTGSPSWSIVPWGVNQKGPPHVLSLRNHCCENSKSSGPLFAPWRDPKELDSERIQVGSGSSSCKRKPPGCPPSLGTHLDGQTLPGHPEGPGFPLKPRFRPGKPAPLSWAFQFWETCHFSESPRTRSWNPFPTPVPWKSGSSQSRVPSG